MVLFKLNPHVIIFFSFVIFLLLQQSVSKHDNVPFRFLKDSKLSVFDTGVVQEEEKENTEDEERVKEGKDEVNIETEDKEVEIEKGEKKIKKKKANKDDEKKYEEFDENGKEKKNKGEEKTKYEEFDQNRKKEKDNDVGKGEKEKKKFEKDGENEAYDEFDENEKKKKTGEKDNEKEAYEEFDENGKKKKKDEEQKGYEEFDDNGKKKKKKDEKFHELGTEKETKDEEKAKDKDSSSSSSMSSSSNSLNSIESLLSFTDSLKRNPNISPAIVQGCKKADYPPECEATLLSTAKDAKNFDASSIFETSVKVLSKGLNVSKTLTHEPNKGISPTDASDCEKMYKDSISALKGAMKAFKENDKYMTSLKLSTVVTNMDTCENGIGQDSTSDLAQANKVLSKLAANAISLGDAAMHFNSD